MVALWPHLLYIIYRVGILAVMQYMQIRIVSSIVGVGLMF